MSWLQLDKSPEKLLSLDLTCSAQWHTSLLLVFFSTAEGSKDKMICAVAASHCLEICCRLAISPSNHSA